MASLSDIREEYEFLDSKDDRQRLIIELGRELEPMPAALKVDKTLVKGCNASVWTYPTRNADGSLHFLADSTSAITKGIIALVVTIVQDRAPADILSLDINEQLEPFDVKNHLSSSRTSGIPNMIKLIRETAERYAG